MVVAGAGIQATGDHSFTDRAAAQMVFDMEIAWLLGYFVSFAVYRVCIVG